MNPFQHTVKKSLKFRGIGLHSGKPATLTIKPAEADCGICFVRTDLGTEKAIPASMHRVVDTTLATTLAAGEARISTTEHLLAALSGLGVDNARIELDGPEVPIMDGSAVPFVHILKKHGLRRQKAFRRLVRITRPVTFQDGDRTLTITPYDGFKITAVIDFKHPVIRSQTYSIEPGPQTFAAEIASARTFGFLEDVEKLQAMGLARGGSFDNAVVVGEDGVLNEGGLRFKDEFVRHKVLDIMGDLALLGYRLLGHIVAHKTGHGQHLGLMQELEAHPECWEWVEFQQDGNVSVLDKVVSTTMAAGNRLMPILGATPACTPCYSA